MKLYGKLQPMKSNLTYELIMESTRHFLGEQAED